MTGKTVQVAGSSSGYTYSNEVTYVYKNVLEYGSYYVDEYVSKVNGTTSASFTYEYDSVGNITKITDKDGNEVRYTYGTLDMLTTVEDEISDKKYVYNYDNAGNITSIVTSVLSSGDSGGGGGDDDDFGTLRLIVPPFNPPSTTTTVNFTYTDSRWGDLLTSYDGTAITYDAIGNPLSYYKGSACTFAWTSRRITSAVKDSSNMYFIFDVAITKP